MSGLFTDTQDPNAQTDPNTQDPNAQTDPNTQDPNTQGLSAQDPNTQDPNTQDPNTQDPSVQDPVEKTKPEWVAENFWDVDKKEVKVETLSKSYNDLRKEFNKQNNDKPGKLPEDYTTKDFMEREEVKKLGNDDPVLKLAVETAKNVGLGVKKGQNFISEFLKNIDSLPSQIVNTEEELKKLGDNGAYIVLSTKQWVETLYKEGEVNKDIYESLNELGQTAAGVKILDVFRKRSGERDIPVENDFKNDNFISQKEWYTMQYDTHKLTGETREQFEDRMHKLGEKLFGNTPGNFSGAGLGIDD